ncbi:CPBP family intramembrane glutamic endopeptidase [Dyadobacter sp. CY312]|uniref:CPBP family intramembrane glutamic endopeptidase n=1 Tax=Dyadobacter sp. CY312 TaxID=2907303 RepID=UPI001F247509|nr:CPBP family intramembrane glutamic endopeptidase [Dyadobacter sp. CY312]MCE7043181.1 CPBP family intramembrane metalloprotease [Dyadobacter sp. CY312]
MSVFKILDNVSAFPKVKNNSILIFLILTFIWSWGNWGMALYFLRSGSHENANYIFMVLFFLGVYGPTLASIIVTAATGGVNSVNTLVKKYTIWQASSKIYILIFALPILIMLIGIGIFHLSAKPVGPFSLPKLGSVLWLVGSGLFAGPLGEELGWRGYLLPKLQERYSSFKCGVLIGLVWFCWHIPLFFAPVGALVANGDITVLYVSVYLIATMCLSFLFTYLSNITQGSVFVAILTHLSINSGLAIVFFPTLMSSENYLSVIRLAVIPLVIFTIYIVYKTKFSLK